MGIYGRILHYQKKYWGTTTVAYICLLTASLIDLYMPDLVPQVIDCGINRAVSTRSNCPGIADPLTLVAGAAMLTVGLTIVKGVLQWGQGFCAEYGAQGIARDLRQQL